MHTELGIPNEKKAKHQKSNRHYHILTVSGSHILLFALSHRDRRFGGCCRGQFDNVYAPVSGLFVSREGSMRVFLSCRRIAGMLDASRQ